MPKTDYIACKAWNTYYVAHYRKSLPTPGLDRGKP